MTGVGYSLYTYKEPDQIAQLVGQLLKADDTRGIAIHHDANSGPLERFTPDSRVDILDHPVKVRWAHWSQVEAIVRTTDSLLRQHPDVDWIVLLSGQDWPVVPVEQIGPTLAGLEVDACIDANDARDEWGWDASRRYGRRWYDVPRRLQSLGPRLERINSVRGLTYLRHYGSMEVQLVGVRSSLMWRRPLFGGSEYFMMNREAWRAVKKMFDGRSLERRALARSLVPTETFFATAVARRNLRIGPSRRYMRFVVGEGNPEYLAPDDAGKAVEQGCLFARKLAPQDVSAFRAAVERTAGG